MVYEYPTNSHGFHNCQQPTQKFSSGWFKNGQLTDAYGHTTPIISEAVFSEFDGINASSIYDTTMTGIPQGILMSITYRFLMNWFLTRGTLLYRF